MRNALKTLGLVVLMVTSFAVGIFVSTVLHLGSPIVTVNLHNASSKEIVSLRLIHEHGLVEVQNIAVNATRIVRFYAPGESSYNINLAFSDGKSLQGGAGYVEAGYTVTETITEGEIKSEFHLLDYRP